MSNDRIHKIKTRLKILEIERENIKKAPYGGAPLVVEAIKVDKEYTKLKEELAKLLAE